MAPTESSTMRVCVIGANGFIGRNSVAALRKQGYQIRATVRKRGNPEEKAWSEEGVEVMEADITEPSTLPACVEGCDVVVNCAGIYRWWVPDNADFVRVNEEGAGNVAEACLAAGVRRLIHYSTPMSYGYPEEKPFTEASKPGPHASEYARTKRLGDVRVKDLCQEKPIELVILHLGCTIGEGDTASAGRIAAVIRDHMQGKIPMLVGPDTNFIYVHIADVRQAVVRAVEAAAEKVKGQDFFIANSDEMMTTSAFFDLVGKHTEKPPPKRSLNLSIGYAFASVTTWIATNITASEPTAPVDIMRTAKFGSIEYRCDKSKEVLGMEYTPIDMAVAESAADVKSRM